MITLGMFAWIGHLSLVLAAAATFSSSLSHAFPPLAPIALVLGALAHVADDLTPAAPKQ